MIDIDKFASRHIGPRNDDIASMLKFVNCKSLDELIKKTVPEHILFTDKLKLKPGMSEKASKNVFLVKTMYLLISDWSMGLLNILKSSHHSNTNPAAAPRRGVITIEPLPTTLPVTITLGPMYLSRSIKVFGAVVIKNLLLF